MAGRIRGITIEIGGDTQGLVKSLKSASKATQDVQKELKDINKVLKFDPTSTELLSQKQKALKENVEATKAQLAEEEKALAELGKAGDSPEAVKAQEALQRQITETKNKLKEAEGELKSFGSVGAQQVAAVGEKFQQLGGQIEKVGQGLTKNVTAPIMAVGGASIAAFNSVDEGLDVIIKKTGATGESLEDMEGIFKNIATRVPAEMTEIGSAVGEINTRFGSTGEELEGLSEQFLKFAQLNDQDVSSSIDQTQKALAAYGKGAESAGEFLDVMNKVAQNTGVSVDKLQNGIVSNATAFQELGLSLSESTSLMGQLEKSGANSETVLNGLRKALKNAAAEGVPLDTALANLQETIESGGEGMDGLTAAYDLFGKSGDQIYGAVKNGTLNFKELATTLTETEGSVANTFEAMQDPTDKFKLAMQGLKLAGADIGTSILTTLTPAIEKLRDLIGQLSEKWQSLSPEMQDIIVKIAMVAAAVGPVLIVIGKVVSTVGTIMSIVPKLTSAISLIASPVGIAVAAFAALVAAGVLIYKNWDVIKEKAIKIWTAIKDFFTKIFTSIKSFFTNTWRAIANFFVTIVTSIRDGVVNRFVAIRDRIKAIIQAIRENIVAKFRAIRDIVVTIVQAIREGIVNRFTRIYEGIRDKIQAAREVVVAKFRALRESAIAIVQGIREGIVTRFQRIYEGIRDKIQAAKDKAVEKFRAMRETLGAVASSIKEKITAPFEKAKTLVTTAIDKIKGLFPLSIGKIFSNIKLPHFKVNGGEFPYGIGGKGSKPTFSIDWYKKAMGRGMILDGPTIFGVDTYGHFMGGGEAGREWVIGENSILSMIQNATRTNGIDPELVYEAVRRGASDATIKAYLSGRDVTDDVNRGISKIQTNNARFQGA